MENLMMLFQGFGVVFTLENLGVCLLGAILGLVVGAMPGIGSLAGCGAKKEEAPAASAPAGNSRIYDAEADK